MQVAFASHAGVHCGVQVVPLPLYPLPHTQVFMLTQVACGSHVVLQVMSAQVVPLPLYPASHVHTGFPAAPVQLAWSSQLPLLVAQLIETHPVTPAPM